jgi:hypothetical protein
MNVYYNLLKNGKDFHTIEFVWDSGFVHIPRQGDMICLRLPEAEWDKWDHPEFEGKVVEVHWDIEYDGTRVTVNVDVEVS